MARSMDMVVTDNLDTIIRQMESGPRLAQKYIENPVTIDGRKIDLRFIVAVKSVRLKFL
jgi:tubulin--tyrosine ligase-like protein 12